jgi:ArsR family transcriptional regulator, arsenate/arsenite/antimonite-responsive transcriptional repressor
MKTYLAITKALSDPSRVRALSAMRGGELCLCQLVELLKLAPSTASQHLSLLHEAGLVERRKEGRWHYYRLAGRSAPAVVRRALAWTLEAVGEEPAITSDAKKLCCVRRKDLKELAGCYSAS